MVHRVSFAEALYFTKLSVYLACTWPSSRATNKRETVKYDIIWSVSFLSSLCLLLPLLFSISKYHDNSLIVTQSVCYVGATCNLLVKMIIHRIHNERTRTLIFEMEDFLEKAKPHEILVFQRYLDRCSTFHIFISVVNYLTTAVIVTAPLFDSNQPLPTNAVYPFSVESGIPMYLAYAHQSIAGFQNSSGVTIDCQVAMTMWFASARLEILADELEIVDDAHKLKNFVRKHRETLNYASKVSDTMRYVALVSSFVCGIAAIMSSVQLFGDQPFFVKLQFGPVALIATMNLFVCAWPADHMINVCNLFANAVYNVRWIDMPDKMMKNVLFLLRRCQRPVVVFIPGLLPTLSLSSYASFLSALFSYFTTLRLVMASKDE